MTDDPIAALRAAYEKTTQGEWEVDPKKFPPVIRSGDVSIAQLFLIERGADPYPGELNAAFIVTAHTHVPALIAEVEKSRRVTQSIKDTLALLPTYPADKVPEILDYLRELLEQMDMPKPAE